MHYEGKKTGFKFDAVSGVPKENTVEAFEELFAANKAAEGGGLPKITIRTVREAFEDRHAGYEFPSEALKDGAFSEFLAGWRTADRASRQGSSVPDCFANKAEVELILQARSPEGDPWQEVSGEDFFKAHTNGYEVSVCVNAPEKNSIRLEATPPATTGASTELRDDLKFSYNAPEVESYVVKNSACLSNGLANFYAYLSVQAESFDKWEKCVAECADGAKEVVELQFKVGDQEWAGSFRELFKILAKPVGASTLLTDERIEELIAQVPDFDIGNYDLHLLARHVEREIAAQAGQVAVPEQLVFTEEDYRMLHAVSGYMRRSESPRCSADLISLAERLRNAQQAAPLPAKESK